MDWKFWNWGKEPEAPVPELTRPVAAERRVYARVPNVTLKNKADLLMEKYHAPYKRKREGNTVFFEFLMPNGETIRGQGQNNAQALANAEQRMARWTP